MEYQNDQMSTKKSTVSAGGKKRTVVTILIAAVAVIAIATVGVSVLTASPLALVGTGFANSVKAVEKGEAAVFLEKVTDGGSVELLYGLDDLLESTFGISVDAAAQLKLYNDGDDGAALAVDLKLGGEVFLDAMLNATRQDITLTSDKLLGDVVYGVDLEKAAEHFEGSVFGPNGSYSLGIDSVDDLTNSITQSEQLEEDTQEIEESLFAALLKSVNQHAEVSKENSEVEFNGVQAKTTAVRIALDCEALAKVVEDMVEYLYTDEELKQFLHTYDALIVEYLVSMDLISDYDDPSEVINDFYASLEEIYRDPAELKEQIEDSGMTLDAVFYISKSDKELVGIELMIEMDGEEFVVSLLAGPTLTDLREVTLEIEVDGTLFLCDYRVDINDRTEYAATFSAREDGDELAGGEFHWDKKTGDYALELRDAYEDIVTLEGTLEMTAQRFALSIVRIASSGVEQEVQLALTVMADDKKPAIPGEYTDLLTMTQGQVEDLTADLAAALMNEVYTLDPDILSILSYLMFSFA